MRFHGKPDFGNTILGMGADDPDIDSETEKKSSSDREAEKDTGMGCSKGMCEGMAAATNSVMGALGPALKPHDDKTMATLASDKSPAGQAQYEAALAHNAEVAKQNAERQGIIDQFVKDAIGGQVTKEQMALGDAAHVEYEKIVAKYGEDVRYMTLAQMVSTYPQDAKAVVASLGQVFPALKGKSFEQIWSTIPESFKQMQLIDLEKAIPNSSWIGAKTSTGKAVAPGVVGAAGIGLALLAVGGIAFMFLRKKGSNAPRT